MRAIGVSLHGVERLDPAWVKPEEPSDMRAPKTNAGLNPGERCIAKSPVGAVAEGVVVRAGDVVERVVRVRLPPGLPPTFRGAVSRVSYFITCVAATADAREEAPDPPKAWERAHARVPLRVRAPDRDGFNLQSSSHSLAFAREETTLTDGTADGHDAGIFWMHELACAAGKTKKTRATLNPPSPRRASGTATRTATRKKNTTRIPRIPRRRRRRRRRCSACGPRLARNSGRTSGRRAPARRSPRRAGPPRTARRRPFRSTNRPRRTGIRPGLGGISSISTIPFFSSPSRTRPPRAADESWPW